MANAPIVSWREGDNSAILEKWGIGQVDAGEASPEKEILIWNNHGGAEDVAHMQNCKITTTDGAGETMDVVAEKWVYAKCNTAGDLAFTQIGGDLEDGKLAIGAAGIAAGSIHGTANTGAIEDTANFAKVTCFFKSKLHEVTAGPRSFRLRVEYFYV